MGNLTKGAAVLAAITGVILFWRWRQRRTVELPYTMRRAQLALVDAARTERLEFVERPDMFRVNGAALKAAYPDAAKVQTGAGIHLATEELINATAAAKIAALHGGKKT